MYTCTYIDKIIEIFSNKREWQKGQKEKTHTSKLDENKNQNDFISTIWNGQNTITNESNAKIYKQKHEQEDWRILQWLGWWWRRWRDRGREKMKRK